MCIHHVSTIGFIGLLVVLVTGCGSLEEAVKPGGGGRLRLERCMAAAEEGDAKAQHELGCYYASGADLATNHAEAVKWWGKSARQGYAPAQNNLGVCYNEGWGVDPDPGLAVSWFRKAAEKNDPKGLFNLGTCYDKGQEVAKDKAEAVRWYEKAARGGSDKALNNLAWIWATSDATNLRNPSGAVASARKAVAAMKRKDPHTLDTLAAAYAATGEFEKAVSTELEALALLGPEATRQADYTARLQLYQAKTPYRSKD
jgi:tetratricopeptide (TPR) repeat protein